MPIIPILFLLCAEGLSALIQDAIANSTLHGFSCSRPGPIISHLFFADDSLVFCKATVEQCMEVKRILGVYEGASGQMINFSKSAISYSPNVSSELQEEIMICLGLNTSLSHDKYLCLPTLVGRNERSTFNSIKEKFWKKLQRWRGKLFSTGGKEVLLKAVAKIIVYKCSIL